jgi:hypothetical protein
MYTAISVCTLLAKLRAERYFVCMCLPAYEVEKEMREMWNFAWQYTHTRTYIWTCHEWKSSSLRKKMAYVL